MQSVPMYREALTSRTDWDEVATKQFKEIFARTPDKDDVDIKRLAAIYEMEGIEEVLGEAPLELDTGDLVVCTFNVVGIDGEEKVALKSDFKPNEDDEDQVSTTPRGEFIRKKLTKAQTKAQEAESDLVRDCT